MKIKHAYPTYVPFVFTFISGYLDVISFMALGEIFVSFMSGNSTRLGMYIALGNYTECFKFLALIGAFILGALFANLFDDQDGLKTYARIIWADVVLLTITLILMRLHHTDYAFFPLTVAMGFQNKAQVDYNGKRIGKSFMTGALYSLGESLADWLKGSASLHSILPLLMTWVLFVFGAVVGSMTLVFMNFETTIMLLIGFLTLFQLFLPKSLSH